MDTEIMYHCSCGADVYAIEPQDLICVCGRVFKFVTRYDWDENEKLLRDDPNISEEMIRKIKENVFGFPIHLSTIDNMFIKSYT